MEQDVTSLFEKLLPTSEQVGSLPQGQAESIDLFAWLANALWQIKECDPEEKSLEIRIGVFSDELVKPTLPLFEKRGWKAEFHGDNMMIGDGSSVKLTRA